MASTVYGLFDLLDNDDIFYVGLTTRTMQQREEEHHKFSTFKDKKFIIRPIIQIRNESHGHLIESAVMTTLKLLNFNLLNTSGFLPNDGKYFIAKSGRDIHRIELIKKYMNKSEFYHLFKQVCKI